MDFKLLLCSTIAITWAMVDAKSADDPGFKLGADDEGKLELLIFRAKMDADTILDEDWTDMERTFPYKFMTGGIPSSLRSVALYIPVGMWDLTAFATFSEDDKTRYFRYIFSKIFEDASRKAGFNFHSNQDDLPKFDIVVDLKGTGRMSQELGLDIQGVFKKQVELLVQKGIKALAHLGKAHTMMYREAVDAVLFVNVPLGGPNLGCLWESEGSFHCRQFCHENEIGPCEDFVV